MPAMRPRSDFKWMAMKAAWCFAAVLLCLPLAGRWILYSQSPESEEAVDISQTVNLDGPLNPDQQAQVASCVIGVLETIAFAGQGGLAVRAAQLNCADPDPAVCTALVNGVILCYTWVASLISATVANCGKTVNTQAQCAADILCVTANVADLITAAAVVDTTCKMDAEAMDFDFKMPPQALEEDANMSLRGEEIAACLFDVVQVAVNLGNAALALRQSLANCVDENGVIAQPETCSINILNIILLWHRWLHIQDCWSATVLLDKIQTPPARQALLALCRQ
eukprot:TRINITY_DN21390_c0_g2_i1.p1 TRINITY_DN21390_c0_g2~~TRINITY_DN21390_c0_g2_i1.p1  ORF type:complete len:294 (-),score=39.71 TRINITY_DN21390_c0_g2_i1:1124-1966(-)